MDAAPEIGSAQRDRLMLGLGLAAWMEFFTFDAVNLILPDVAGAFAASQDQASWVLTTYTSSLFLGTALSVPISSRIGHLRFITLSIALFAVASVGCVATNDLSTLLLCRSLQGLAGAGLTVSWRAMVYMLVSGPPRGVVVKRISMILYLGTAVGLLCGGWIVDNADWRIIFLLNVPVAFVAAWTIRRNFPGAGYVKADADVRVDAVGGCLLTVCIISFQIVISRGEVEDWLASPQLAVLASSSLLTFVIFVLWQCSRRNRSPIFAPELFRDRNVVASVVLGTCAGIILSGSIYALPEYLRGIDPHTASRTGQIMCVYALAGGLLRPVSGRVIARVGQRKALAGALAFLIASMLVFARTLTSGTPDGAYILPLLLYAACLTPLLSAVGGGTVSRLPRDRLLAAVPIYTTFRQLGASLGVTLVTLVLDVRETQHTTRLFDHLVAGGSKVQAWLARAGQTAMSRGGYTLADSRLAALGLLKKTALGQAATLAYADAFYVMAAIGVLTLCLAPIMAPTPVRR